jgi:hypothetical protein
MTSPTDDSHDHEPRPGAPVTRHYSFYNYPDHPASAIPESLLSTRGSALPGLLTKSASSTSLFRLGHSHRPASVQWDEEAPPPLLLTDGITGVHTPDRRVSLSGEAGLALNAAFAAHPLFTPQMRSQRLIGNSNPRYKWERYLKSDEELKEIKNKGVREYYAHNNSLCFRFMYIDRLLDSSVPHNLIQEYESQRPEQGNTSAQVDIPSTIPEETASPLMTPGIAGGASVQSLAAMANGSGSGSPNSATTQQQQPGKVVRTAKNLYRVPSEQTPLLEGDVEDDDDQISPKADDATWRKAQEESGADDGEDNAKIVRVAIYINLGANTILLIGKIIVMLLTSSLSVLASLVDAALDFLSTGIIWTTTWLMSRRDPYSYPVGRSRLEPIGVLVFSVIMVTSFFQVSLECISRLSSDDHSVVELTIPAIAIMASTVVIKFACWLWCRMIKNSGVQALAQDAMTDVVFNIFSIIFPLSESFSSCLS